MQRNGLTKFDSIEESKSVRNVNSRAGNIFIADQFNSPIKIADMSNSFRVFLSENKKDTSRIFGNSFFETRNSNPGTKLRTNPRNLNINGNQTELKIYHQNSDFLGRKESKPMIWNKAEDLSNKNFEYPRKGAISKLEGPKLSIKVDSFQLLDRERTKTPILQDIINNDISPIIGRLNNFSTKSYFNEFRETKKYNSGSHSPVSQKNENKSPNGYLDIIEAHPKVNLMNLKKDKNRFSKFGHIGIKLNNIPNLNKNIVLDQPAPNNEFYAQSSSKIRDTKAVIYDMFKSRRRRFPRVDEYIYKHPEQISNSRNSDLPRLKIRNSIE